MGVWKFRPFQILYLLVFVVYDTKRGVLGNISSNLTIHRSSPVMIWSCDLFLLKCKRDTFIQKITSHFRLSYLNYNTKQVSKYAVANMQEYVVIITKTIVKISPEKF